MKTTNKIFIYLMLLIASFMLTTLTNCEKDEEKDPQVINDNGNDSENGDENGDDDEGFDYGEITDSRDGNTYKTIQLGDQIWMAENLKYLPEITIPEIGSNEDPYFYVYNYFGSNVSEAKENENYKTYGVLYNWTAAMNLEEDSDENPSGIQGICPTGWHLPSDAEWKQLEIYLGMTEAATNEIFWRGNFEGSMLAGNKELWETGELASYSGFGSTGFHALPGGRRMNESFQRKDTYGHWWSTSVSGGAFYRDIAYDNPQIYRSGTSKNHGYSVRCVKD